MPESTIVPPVPTINQSDSPEQIASAVENVQAIFDKVSPKIRGTPTPEAPSRPPEPPPAPAKSPEPVKAKEDAPVDIIEPPAETGEKVEPVKRGEEHKIPSFIEKALEVKPETAETPAQPVEDEFPEELPAKEAGKTNWKRLREQYKTLKTEVEQLRSRPAGIDEPTKQELEFLRSQNKELSTVLSRTEVEHHREFQQKIVQPMNAAWSEAARIVKEIGRDPQDLAKALSLSGAAQYEALDELFTGMPESAKIRVNNAVATVQSYDNQRKAWLADAPRRAEELKKSDYQRQLQQLAQQKDEMRGLFDLAIQKLRDEAKVEVLQKSNDPDAKWWNEQADQIVETSRNVFLENTDMQKVAYACALAPMADVYRKLWLTTRAELAKKDGIIKEKFGSEPNMSESGGNVRNGTPSLEEDLKKPIGDVFLGLVRKQREAGVR